MSRLYKMAYKVGFCPWDSGPPQQELIDLVTGPDRLPPGRAIDLGCGTGRKAVFLAEHGWDVTGVDQVAEALDQARENARERGVEISWIQGDVSWATTLELSEDFDFLLDVGCAHSMKEEAIARYPAQLKQIARPGATLFLFAFTKGPLSVKRSIVDEYFLPHWDLVQELPGQQRRTPDAGPVWYRFTRRGG